MRYLRGIRTALQYMILIVITLITLFPIFYVVASSFKSNMEILTSGINILPKNPVLDNYKQAWELANFKRYTFNSIYLCFFSVLGIVITSSLAGYTFARGNFVGKKLIFAVFTSTMFISFGSATLNPLLGVASALHINKNLWGIILIKVFGVNITNIFLVRGHVLSLPKEMDEAAKIDGCDFFQIFVYIIAPLLKPILATVALLSFQASWNDYLLPMVFTLGNKDSAPLIVGIVSLKSTGAAAASWNLMMAGTTISLIPILIVFLCMNKYFIKGLTSGAVKG